jgi:hypothetical protein
MGFVGRKPTNAPLVSSDLGTGIVGSTNIADNAVLTGKIADGTITLDDLSATGTKDATTFLRGDNTFAEVPAGGNAPYFEAYSAGDQNISDETITKVTLGTEAQDSDSKFASSRFTVTESGIYYIEGNIYGGSATGQGDVAQLYTYLYLNGSSYKFSRIQNEDSQSDKNGNISLSCSAIISLTASDYIELYGYVDRGSGQAKFFAGTKSTYLLGFKIG